MVSVEDIRTIERSQWEILTLNHIAKPLLSIPSLREQTPLTEAIDRLEALQVPRITVLSPADAVAGIIDRGEIVRAIADRLGLRISPAIIQRIKEDGQYPPGLQLASIARAAGDEVKA